MPVRLTGAPKRSPFNASYSTTVENVTPIKKDVLVVEGGARAIKRSCSWQTRWACVICAAIVCSCFFSSAASAGWVPVQGEPGVINTGAQDRVGTRAWHAPQLERRA